MPIDGANPLLPGDVWRDPDGVEWTVHRHHCPLEQCVYAVELVDPRGRVILPSALSPASELVHRGPAPERRPA